MSDNIHNWKAAEPWQASERISDPNDASTPTPDFDPDGGMVPASAWRRDPYDLNRFVLAQNGAYSCDYRRVWDDVRSELRAGRKESHWMWFIFPQEKHLGSGFNSRYYGIRNDAEARAYLAHPVLGPRYGEAVSLVFEQIGQGRSQADVFGELDAIKFRSSVDLFLRVSK